MIAKGEKSMIKGDARVRNPLVMLMVLSRENYVQIAFPIDIVLAS